MHVCVFADAEGIIGPVVLTEVQSRATEGCWCDAESCNTAAMPWCQRCTLQTSPSSPGTNQTTALRIIQDQQNQQINKIQTELAGLFCTEEDVKRKSLLDVAT